MQYSTYNYTFTTKTNRPLIKSKSIKAKPTREINRLDTVVTIVVLNIITVVTLFSTGLNMLSW